MNTSKTLHQKLEESGYYKAFWIKNYIKTVITSTLISSGIGLLITGELTRMQNKGYSDKELIVGCILLAIAATFTFIIDKYLSQKEKEKEEIIEEHIDEKAEEIAEQLILKHLEEIEQKNM